MSRLHTKTTFGAGFGKKDPSTLTSLKDRAVRSLGQIIEEGKLGLSWGSNF